MIRSVLGVDFTEAHRYPGGIDKFLFDKVNSLSEQLGTFNIEISKAIELEKAESLKGGKWEHGMKVKPDIAMYNIVKAGNLEDFELQILSIDDENVNYQYKSKGEGPTVNIIRMIAFKDNE